MTIETAPHGKRSAVRIFIADDHAVVRAGLRSYLELHSYEVVGEAAEGAAVLNALRADLPDLLIIDISMPNLNGLEALSAIRLRWPDLPVLVFSGLSAERYRSRALRHGATGYAAKNLEPPLLLAEIERVLRDHCSTPTAVEAADSSRNIPHLSLRSREFDIFVRLARGQRLAEIGAALALSPRTVATYRRRIVRSLAVKTNSDLTYYALKHQLIGDTDFVSKPPN